MLLYTVMPSFNKNSYLILSDLTLLKFQRQQYRKKHLLVSSEQGFDIVPRYSFGDNSTAKNILLVPSEQGFDIVPSYSFRDNSTAKTYCLFRLSRVLTLHLAIVSVITVPQHNILLVSSEQGMNTVPICSFKDNSTTT